MVINVGQELCYIIKITCYKPVNTNGVNITSMNLQHNHEISKTAFQFSVISVSEKEKEVIADLHEANCKASQIARVIRGKI